MTPRKNSAAERILFGKEKKLRLSERRRRTRAFRGLAIVFILLVAVGLVSWLSHHPRLALTEIRVAGVQNMPTQVIRASAESVLNDGKWHVFSRRNIFLYPNEEIERMLLADFPRIREADVGRTGILDSVMLITVQERTPAGVWCHGMQTGECYDMDETGYIYARSATSTDMVRFYGELPNAEPIGVRFLSEHLAGVQRTLDLFAPKRPVAFSVLDGFDYEIEFADGLRVKASFEQVPEVVAGNLDVALSSDELRDREGELEYIDLRFGNRVYFKFKNEEE